MIVESYDTLYDYIVALPSDLNCDRGILARCYLSPDFVVNRWQTKDWCRRKSILILDRDTLYTGKSFVSALVSNISE